MHSTIKERLDALECRIVALGFSHATRFELMRAVRDIAVQQDRITRHACADIILGLDAKPFGTISAFQAVSYAQVLTAQTINP